MVLLRSNFKHVVVMEDTKNEQVFRPHYKNMPNMSVDMYTVDADPENKLLRGRALLNPHKKEFAFVQNTPRGPRSVEVGRTLHSRYVCRPDGDYTVTVRFGAEEKNIREQLLSETRQIVSSVQEHYKSAEAKRKKKLLEAGKEAIEAEKRIAASYEKTSKKMHELLEGGEE